MDTIYKLEITGINENGETLTLEHEFYSEPTHNELNSAIHSLCIDLGENGFNKSIVAKESKIYKVM